ncbi:MAG: PA2778 family cysteine peptidase [Aquabacterium sp.]
MLTEVAAGHPAVVLLNLGLAIAPMWHYAVVIGHDLDRREVLLRSGTTPVLRMALSTFEHTWARSGYWAFVALPAGQLPVTSGVRDVADALAAFERLNPPASALSGYEAALARWPDDQVLGMGLGNTRFALGQFEQAASAFARIAERTDSAAAWNNLAMARWRLGQTAAAQEAARRAVQRAMQAEPNWLAAAQATLQETQQSGTSLKPTPGPP